MNPTEKLEQLAPEKTPRTEACCSIEEQAGCCAPAAKASCCGPAAAKTDKDAPACGCR